MRFRAIADAVGTVTVFFSLTLVVPIIVGLIYHEPLLGLLKTFGLPALLSVVLGGVLKILGEGKSRDIRYREALATVSISWLLMSFIGALPYLLSGLMLTFTDAYFESMSGFTATGATVVEDLTAYPLSLLFWRSFTQWIGGMGVVVLSVAILTALLGGGRAGNLLMRGEVPGHTYTKIAPRVAETAKILWGIYALFTGVETLLLILLGMSPFDALTHSFTTLAGGGFSPRPGNIEYFYNYPHAPIIEVVLMVFMIAGSTNFVLHYRLIYKRDFQSYFKSSEFRVYMGILAIAIVAVMADLVAHTKLAPATALRHASFQVVSIMSTTGYNTVDFGLWPALAQFILFFLLFTGAMSGSTSGSIKLARYMIIFKSGKKSLYRLLHRRSHVTVRVGGEVISDDVIDSVGIFIVLYLFAFIAASLALTAMHMDFVSAISAVATCIGNVGPGLGVVGPASTFLTVPVPGRWVLVTVMWLGRLEIIPCLILFFPETYRR